MNHSLEKRKLGNTGAIVTLFGFGALEIGRDWGLGSSGERTRPDEEEAGKLLNTVLDMGIKFVDTARAYHRSEERIGKFISNRRKEYFLASKCGEYSQEPDTHYDFSYQAVKDSIDVSLKLLNTNQIDLMQIHFGPEPQKVVDDGETVKAMKEAKKEGKIRFLGASTSGDIARQCIESDDFDVMQLDYSLLNTKDEELIKLCGKKGIGVILRGGLGYGRLTPRVMPYLDKENENNKRKIKEYLNVLNGDASFLPSLALQFIAANPDVHSILVGTKSISHLKENLDAMVNFLEPAIIQKATEIAHS